MRSLAAPLALILLASPVHAAAGWPGAESPVIPGYALMSF